MQVLVTSSICTVLSIENFTVIYILGKPSKKKMCGFFPHLLYSTSIFTPYSAFETQKDLKQEWSSLVSSSYDNWDEIEMLFGHLVMVICKIAIGNWLLAEGNRKNTIGNWTDPSMLECSMMDCMFSRYIYPAKCS